MVEGLAVSQNNSKDVTPTVSGIAKIIFESVVRTDCVQGNSTWVGDLAPAGLGFVNYFRRTFDSFGIGTELLYLPVLTAYQAGTAVLMYKGVESLLK